MDSKIAVTLISIGAVVGTGIIAFNEERTIGMTNPRFTAPDVEVAPVEMVAL